MKIYEYTPGKSIDAGDTVIALGLFDGVHKAHRELLSLAKREAEKNSLKFAVFTFESVKSKSKRSQSIYSIEQKLDILRSIGADAVIVADFDDICNVSAKDFIELCLIGDMNCQIAAVGYDFRFGKGAMGDAYLLSSLLSKHNRKAVIEEKQTWRDEKISSTRIKDLLSNGNIEEANLLLSMPYFLSTTVSHGDGRGKALGFPTVNTYFPEGTLVPRYGVYRTAVDIDGRLYSAVTNVGTCPTFGERAAHAESFIIDFDGDLYGKSIRIFFLGFLREEIKFLNENELIMQINIDKNRTIKENGELTWQAIGLN